MRVVQAEQNQGFIYRCLSSPRGYYPYPPRHGQSHWLSRTRPHPWTRLDQHLQRNIAARSEKRCGLQYAALIPSQSAQVDFILLAGDLFHENRPSRDCLYQVMSLLREYTLGDKPVQIELLSDRAEGKAAGFSYANLSPFRHVLLSVYVAFQPSTTRTAILTSRFLFFQFTETMMTHRVLGRLARIDTPLSRPFIFFDFSGRCPLRS